MHLSLRPALDPSPPRVHRINPALVKVAIVIILLNLIDAFGTLRHVAHGAEEVNPLMAHLLDRGPLWFFLGKFLLATGGVFGIVAYGRSRAAKIALCFVLLPLYLLVAGYQLVLFTLI